MRMPCALHTCLLPAAFGLDRGRIRRAVQRSRLCLASGTVDAKKEQKEEKKLALISESVYSLLHPQLLV